MVSASLRKTKMAIRNSLITVAATLLLLSGPIAQAQTSWRTFGFDRQRTGYNPEEAILSPQTVPSLTARWSIDLGAPMTAQPIEMNGILYTATWGGAVYALDPASGNIIWMQQLGAVATPCADFAASGYTIGVIHTLTSDWGNGRIFAISGDGLLHAFDAITGFEWSGFPIQIMDPSNIDENGVPTTYVYGEPRKFWLCR
jgi:outer membrane protein assembly factor BamB